MAPVRGASDRVDQLLSAGGEASVPGSPSLSPTSVIMMLVRACATAYWGKHLDVAPPVETRRLAPAYPSDRLFRGRPIEGRP